MNFIYKDNFGSAGLFAYFWRVMQVLHDIGSENKLFVDLRNTTPFFDSNYQPTNNVWEYYFEQPSDLTVQCYEQEHHIINFNENNVKQMLFGISNGKYDLYHKDRADLGRKLIKKYLKYKPHIKKEANKFAKFNFKNKKVLGVHVRGGDHFTVGHARGQNDLMSYEYYFSKIDKQIDDYDSLFMISNDIEPRLIFKDRYKDKLCFYEHNFLASSKDNVATFNIHHDQNYKKGEAAAIECLLLSMCDKKIITSSNLGFVSVLSDNSPYELIDDHIVYRD